MLLDIMFCSNTCPPSLPLSNTHTHDSSHNGSPLAATEPGTVIATVCKKRRGNNNNESAAAAANAGTTANVEIDIGEGQYISLNDPNGVRQLDAQMKQTAASQLKVLQDQMASLMAQLNQ